MSQYFMFKDGKIIKTTFADKSLKTLAGGPFILKTEVDGMPSVYFVGLSDEAHEYLRDTGRIAAPLANLVDDYILFLQRHGVTEFDTLDHQTWHDLKVEYDKVKKYLPDIITFSNKPSSGESVDIGSSDRNMKFASMLG